VIQQPHDNEHCHTRAGLREKTRCWPLLAGWLVLAGCRATMSDVEIPRTLGGQPRVGRFVPPFAYESYVRGELALMRGDFHGAIDAFELAAAAPDEDAYVLSRLAWAQAMAGDTQGSARSLAQAERVDPCSEPVWMTRAKLSERKRDLPSARDQYARAAACAPHSAQGPLDLSRVLVALGERERAQGVLEAFAARADQPASFEAALELALSRQDALAAGVALDGLFATGVPPTGTLSGAVEQALAMGRPLLASELLAHQKSPISPKLAARVCLALSDPECAQGKLLLARVEELGGPTQAVELLLLAQLYERAEIEASMALLTLPSARLYRARAAARAALGDAEGALADLRVSEQGPETEGVLSDMLGRAKLGGLARALDEKRTP